MPPFSQIPARGVPGFHQRRTWRPPAEVAGTGKAAHPARRVQEKPPIMTIAADISAAIAIMDGVPDTGGR